MAVVLAPRWTGHTERTSLLTLGESWGYDQLVLDLERLAPFCEVFRFGMMAFLQLVRYSDLPDGLNARPIPSLPEAERMICVDAFEKAVAFLQVRGIAVDVAGGFLEEWKVALQAA